MCPGRTLSDFAGRARYVIAATRATTAMMPRITARTVLPVDLWSDPLVELTIPPCAACVKLSQCLPVAVIRSVRIRVGCGGRGSAANEENLPFSDLPGEKEGADDVLTETFGRSLQHPAPVPSGHIVHERGEPHIVRKHENIQRGMPPRHLVHLSQGDLERLRRGRPV